MKTSTVHDVILDERELDRFIDHFLPDTEPHEKFYVALFARQKYTNQKIGNTNSDKSHLSRFLTTKKTLKGKIQKMEVPLGVYKNKKGDVIPQEALAVYIHPNPRDLRLATIRGIAKLAECVEKDDFLDPVQRMITMAHKCPISKKPFVIFDIDTKGAHTLEKVSAITNDWHKTLVTHGGYHIIIKREWFSLIADHNKMWYTKLMELSDQHGDLMIPVPGCTQGNNYPYFL
jgi:hypothetical protein